MKLRYTIYLTLLVMLASFTLSAQENADMRNLEILDRDYIQPTPSSYVYRKYMASQPSLTTGAVRLDIPVYDINYKGLSLPVSLKYLSNGIKVFDSPYPCGYGWSLHPGLRITRVIVGRPDEYFNHVTPSISGLGLTYDQARQCQLNINNLNQSETVYDSGHDIFYIHLPSGSYTRIIEKTASGIQFSGPDNELKISADNHLNTITVVDTKGIEYVFGACREAVEGAEFVTGWMLQRINMPFGDTITVTWHRITNYATHRRYFSCVAYNDMFSINPAQCDIETYENINRINSRPYIDPHSYCYAPASIVWPAGRVDFTYTMQNSGEFLTKIEVKDHNGSSVKTCSLTYAADRDRLLSKVSLSDEGKYSFSYNSRDFESDNAQDWWGFYNGMTTNESLVPKLKLKTYPVLGATGHYMPQAIGDADRSVDVSEMQANILTKVVYPTGGSSTFEYEAHHLGLPTDITSPEIDPAYDITPTVGGGLRVKSITTNPTDGTQPIVRRYAYGSGESGIATCRSVPSPKTFVEICTTPSVSYTEESENNGYSFNYRRVTLSATSNHDNFSLGETCIWYPEVTEYNDDSKTVYQFEEIGSPNHYANAIGSDIHERMPVNIHRAASSGPMLVSETRYARHGSEYTPLISTQNQYAMLSCTPQVSDWYIRYNIKNTLTGESPDFPFTAYMSGQYATIQQGSYIIRWDYNGMYTVSSYHLDLAVEQLASRQTTSYLSQGSTTLNRTFTYVPGTSIVRKITTSDGHTTRTRTISYAACYDAESDLIEQQPVFAVMVARNIISQPVALKDSVDGCIWKEQYLYTPIGTGFAATSVKVKRGNEAKTLGSFVYDTRGNLLASTVVGKGTYALQWDARGLYPIKKTLVDPYNQADLSWTYAYRPLVGLSSVTDPAGVKTNYSYDARSRLTQVSVDNHGTLSRYEYGIASDNPGWEYMTNAGASNYVREHAALDANALSSVAKCTYFDGIGRSWQEVVEPVRNTPGVSSVVDYDTGSRVVRKWQSVPASGMFTSRDAFAQAAQTYYNDMYPFTSYGFGARQGESPDTIRRPGAYLQLTSAPSTISLSVNTTRVKRSCISFGVDDAGNLQRLGRYPAGKLIVQTITDEDGHEKLIFENLFGEKVLERSVVASGIYADTYYVYDGYGKLRYVLSPKASETLASSTQSASWPSTSEIIDKLCYYYEYDIAGSVTLKKLPGRDAIEYLYDSDGVPVLSQDGNQRALGKWTFSIPDATLRPCLEGEIRLSRTTAVAMAESTLRAHRSSEESTISGYAVCYASGSTFDLSAQDFFVDVATYYDDYSFIDDLDIGNPEGYAFNTSGGNQQYTLAVGRVTGRCISDRPEVMYYDRMGNVTQMYALNQFGNIDRKSSTYTYSGQPLHVETYHKRNNANEYTETFDYAYDAAGRPTTITHKINDLDPKIISANHYNDLGQIGLVDIAEGNYTVERSYDLQGRLFRIQSPCFNQTLAFEGSGASANGNINSNMWDYGAGSSPGSIGYVYDGLNRLVSSSMPAGGTALTQYTYDKNSNPTYIKRYGVIDRIDGDVEMGVIDEVTLQYDGNQATSATDTAAELNYSGATDFEGGASEYTWDSNGNMTSDTGKGISYVNYNRHNLPVYVNLGRNGDVQYTYDGLGRKLTRSVNAPHISLHNVSPNSLGGPVGPIPVRLTTYYHDNYIYESNGTRILIPGGYIMKQGSTYSYHYYVNDYQGNVRAVVDENGNLEEANDYYPYGMLMTDDSGNIANVQPYKFSAKEYETCYGLNIYDFGARWLNPAALIFTTPDPMCEKYYSISPYIYCAGNPVMLVDPSGMVIEDPEGYISEYVTQLKEYYEKLNGITDPDVRSFVKEIETALKELDVLEKSDQIYKIIKNNGTQSGAYYSLWKNKYIISFSGKDLKNNSLIAHEMKHAYQYEIGEISFGYDGSYGQLYDINDEVEAYTRQQIVGIGKAYFDEKGKPAPGNKVDKAYVYEQGEKFNISTYKNLPLKNRNISNSARLVHDKRKFPTNVFKGYNGL